MKKVLLLGYNKNQTKLIEKINDFKKNIYLKQTSSKINFNILKEFDLAISFGYKYLISKEIIQK